MLSERQRDAISYYKAYSAPAEWIIGPQDERGRVHVTVVNAYGTWPYVFDADGTCRAVRPQAAEGASRRSPSRPHGALPARA